MEGSPIKGLIAVAGCSSSSVDDVHLALPRIKTSSPSSERIKADLTLQYLRTNPVPLQYVSPSLCLSRCDVCNKLHCYCQF
jgi:hypothetical protein